MSNKKKDMKPGDVLEVIATDSCFVEDVKAWCEKEGLKLGGGWEVHCSDTILVPSIIGNKMKIGILLKRKPYTFEDIDTVYHFVNAAVEKGHKCSIFLYMDSVITANKEMKPTGERNVFEMLKELIDKGVTVYMCGACALFVGIKKNMLVEGATIGGLASVITRMINESDRFFTF